MPPKRHLLFQQLKRRSHPIVMKRPRERFWFVLVLIFLYIIVFTLHSQLMNALSQATASNDSPEAFAPVTRKTILHNFTSPIIKVSKKKKVQASNKVPLPQWMKNYFDWHKKQMSQLSPSNWEQQKFLVLSCLGNQPKCK